MIYSSGSSHDDDHHVIQLMSITTNLCINSQDYKNLVSSNIRSPWRSHIH